MVVKFNNDLFAVFSVAHRTPGNLRGFVQAKMRNLRSGTMIEHRFSSEDKVERAALEPLAVAAQVEAQEQTATQLKLLGGVTYSEQQVAGAANPDSGLFDADTASKLFAPAEEVLSFVLRKEALGEQVTVKTIVDSFTAKPYGWDLAPIEVLIAFLIGGVEVLSFVADRLGLRGGLWDLVGNLDFGLIGFGIIAIFVLSWAISTVIYRRKGYDDLPTRSAPRPGAAS